MSEVDVPQVTAPAKFFFLKSEKAREIKAWNTRVLTRDPSGNELKCDHWVFPNASVVGG